MAPRNDKSTDSCAAHSGCGGKMLANSYGWHCNKCKHRDVDYSRQSVMERDGPPKP
jgi:hypothetical protein